MIYYPQFDVVRINADGYTEVIDTEEFDVFNVTQSISLGTRFTDANGIMLAGLFPVGAANDVLQFSSGSYPFTLQLKAGATPELAVTNNLFVKYTVENLYDTTEPLLAEIYLIDDDNPDVPPVRVGSGSAGASVSFPLQSNVAKSFRVRPITVDENLNRGRSDPDADQPFTLTGTLIQSLWSAFTNVSNATGDDDLFVGIIPNDLMSTDGDWIEAMFAGTYVTNADEKYPVFILDGHNIYAAAESPAGGSWKALLTITRSSASTARCEISFFTILSGSEVVTAITDISTLDFAAPLTVVCHGISDSNDDVVLKVTNATYYTAPPASHDYLTGSSDSDLLTGSSDTDYLWE